MFKLTCDELISSFPTFPISSFPVPTFISTLSLFSREGRVCQIGDETIVISIWYGSSHTRIYYRTLRTYEWKCASWAEPNIRGYSTKVGFRPNRSARAYTPAAQCSMILNAVLLYIVAFDFPCVAASQILRHDVGISFHNAASLYRR